MKISQALVVPVVALLGLFAASATPAQAADAAKGKGERGGYLSGSCQVHTGARLSVSNWPLGGGLQRYHMGMTSYRSFIFNSYTAYALYFDGIKIASGMDGTADVYKNMADLTIHSVTGKWYAGGLQYPTCTVKL